MNLHKYIETILFMLLLPVLFSSCESLEDSQKEWVNEEETVFVGKLDSLKVRSGMNRVEIVGQTTYIRTAQTCEVVYGDKKKTFKIDEIIGEDKLARMIIDDLDGVGYYFDVTVYDSKGNKSLTTEVYGSAYGEDDALILTPKRISKMLPQPNGSINIEWNDAEVSYVILEYEQEDGTTVSLMLDNPEITNLTSWKLGGNISVKGYVWKNEDDLDPIPLPVLTYNFPEEIQKSIPLFGAGSIMNLGPISNWNIEDKFTIELMARYSELAGGDQNLISNEGGPEGCFMLRNNGSTLQYWIIGPNGLTAAQYNDLQTDVWYHFAMTYDRSAATHILYVNGVEVSRASNGGMGIPSMNIQVGCNPGSKDRYMRGNVQNLSIWSRVKSADEIAEDAKKLGKFDGSENDLKAYWPMDVDYGAVVSDITGKFTAEFTNVTWIPVE